jgi:multifunctional methyltransferase subunit TRM112
MRILTHNSLKCPAKAASVGFPLLLEIEDFEVIETECNFDFIKSVLPTLHWPGIDIAAKAIGLTDLPTEYNDELLEDEEFLTAMHNLLIDVHIIKGTLMCPETGSKFAITGGIPNMKMEESDV